MAAPRKNVEINAVKKALDVWGIGGKQANRKFIELVRVIENLNEGELVMKAGDLTKDFVGATVSFKGNSFVLNDIDTPPVVRYNRFYSEGDETDTESEASSDYAIQPAATPFGRITLVLDSKLWRLHKNTIVTLSNLPD